MILLYEYGAEIVRKACQKAYNMSYKTFLEFIDQEPDYYTKDKFELMQKDFARYFCELDSIMAAKFMED